MAYDGTEYSGSQRQPDKRTIQGELESAVATVARRPISVELAGRTDAGVHALGQVASFEDSRSGLEKSRLVVALNAVLPKDISVHSAEWVSAGFDPRRCAKWRAYQYRICNGPANPLERRHALTVSQPLVVAAMAEAAGRFAGVHDLSSFCGLGSGVPWSKRKVIGRGAVRHIYSCSVRNTGQTGITIDVAGDAFLPNQVRTMVGALLEVGRSKRDPDWVTRLLCDKDRRLGPGTAPPHGLILMQVGYTEFEGDSGAERIGAGATQGLVDDGSTNLFS